MIVRYRLALIAVPVNYPEFVELRGLLIDEDVRITDKFSAFEQRPWKELRDYLRTTLDEDHLVAAELDFLSQREHHFGARLIKLPNAIGFRDWTLD